MDGARVHAREVVERKLLAVDFDPELLFLQVGHGLSALRRDDVEVQRGDFHGCPHAFPEERGFRRRVRGRSLGESAGRNEESESDCGGTGPQVR